MATIQDLLNSGMSREEINALLSQSTVSTSGYEPSQQQRLSDLANPANTIRTPGFDPMGITGRGEPYMPPQELPVNMIRNNTTGRVFAPETTTGQPSQSQGMGIQGMSGLPLDYSQNPVKTPYGTGQYLKGDSTRMMITDGPQFGKIVDLGRDTAAERTRTKENLANDATRANIAHTQMQTDPEKAAEYAMKVAAGKQQGEMTGFNTMAQQNATGANALSGIPPAMADQVKALAEGRMAFPSGFALKSPYWQQMLQMVSQYDPSFDAINYNTRAATRKDFTSGKSAENIKSLNTAIGHLATLQQKFDALGNTDYPTYNTIGNWLGAKSGNEKIQSAVGGFDTAKLSVSGEMAKVFRSVGMSQQEIEHWMDRLSSSQSPADFKSTIKTAADLMQGRLDAIGDQYSKGMGTMKQGLDLLSPDAKKTFENLRNSGGSGATSTSVTLPNGQVKVFPSGAAAQAFRMETGLK